MKQLYISDLDGTLLNSGKEVSEYSRRIINALAEKGVYFSVATARSAASSVPILAGLNISIPVVLMNGVVIYDLGKNEYVKTEPLSGRQAGEIIKLLKEYGVSGFMYTVRDNRLLTYYEVLNTKALKDFHDERVKKYNKYFEQTDDMAGKALESDVIYFALIDRKEPLLELLGALKAVSGINVVLYKDNYSEDLWYLEMFSEKASKSSAVRYLRERYGFDRITGFGDNTNDLPLLEACDEFYAVSNSVCELKDKATGIIGDNNSDGVAKFIAGRT